MYIAVVYSINFIYVAQLVISCMPYLYNYIRIVYVCNRVSTQVFRTILEAGDPRTIFSLLTNASL